MKPTNVSELAKQYQVSEQAVETLWQSLVSGNGSMAQFNHPELGGSGQWMAGGMTMVGDMFNQRLKYVVDGICSALAAQARDAASHKFDFVATDESHHTGSYQSQSQSSGPSSTQATTQSSNSGRWWPNNWGAPNSSGSQNEMSYAYFSGPQRLMIREHGEVTVYDTLDHQITGVSQQQSGNRTLTFSSQHGPVKLEDLPKVSVSHAHESKTNNSGTPAAAPENLTPEHQASDKSTSASSASFAGDPLVALEKLGKLRDAGVITPSEFDSKKQELLKRI